MKERQEIHGIFKVGFVINDFDKVVESLKQRQIEIAFGPFPRKKDQRANIAIRDNSENLIQLFGN